MDMKVEDGKKISEKQSVNSNIKYSNKKKNSTKKQNDPISSVTQSRNVVSQLSVKHDHNLRVVS